MITFDEFLTQYSNDIAEIYAGAEMSRNAKRAVVSVMRQYMGERKFDPISIRNLFESVCYSAMEKGSVARGAIGRRVVAQGPNELVGTDDFLPPETNLVEAQERGARGK